MAQNYNDAVGEIYDAKKNAQAAQLNSLYEQGAGSQMTNAQAGTNTGAADTLRNRFNTLTAPANQAPAAAAAPAAEPAAATPAATTPTNTATAERLAGTGAVTTQNRIDEINRMYDAQQAARLAELQASYDINRADLQAAADQIAPNYQQQANANAVDWERQRRNFLEGAAVNGINTGANSQYQLALMGQNQRNMNTIRMAQANAQNEAARNLANLGIQYQANVNSANANADAQRAAALIDEYDKGYNRDAAAAQTLAQYGDFSGYAGLYGDEIARGMADTWAQQNPDVAYVTGRITKDQRDNIKNGRPINDGLDENGVRVVPARGSSSSSGRAMSDVLRGELGQMLQGTKDNGNYSPAVQADYERQMREVNRF